MRVVPALDEVEGRETRFGQGAEAVLVKKLAFERGEEALTHGVVVAVSNGSRGGTNPCFLASKAERDRGVLCLLVGVVNDVLRLAAAERHIQVVEDQ